MWRNVLHHTHSKKWFKRYARKVINCKSIAGWDGRCDLTEMPFFPNGSSDQNPHWFFCIEGEKPIKKNPQDIRILVSNHISFDFDDPWVQGCGNCSCHLRLFFFNRTFLSPRNWCLAKIPYTRSCKAPFTTPSWNAPWNWGMVRDSDGWKLFSPHRDFAKHQNNWWVFVCWVPFF